MSWWLYATAIRADWLGVALGAAGVVCALMWTFGVILIDRGLQRLRRTRT